MKNPVQRKNQRKNNLIVKTLALSTVIHIVLLAVLPVYPLTPTPQKTPSLIKVTLIEHKVEREKASVRKPQEAQKADIQRKKILKSIKALEGSLVVSTPEIEIPSFLIPKTEPTEIQWPSLKPKGTKIAKQKEPKSAGTDEIEGPASTRHVVYRPPLPVLRTLDRAAVVKLKFWVRPDGMVERVVPTIRADVTLESIAIEYMRQWRFSPLPANEEQADQWGIIPIRFAFE